MQERETTSRGREMRDTMYLLPAIASTPKRQRRTPVHIEGGAPICLLERVPSTRDYVYCCDALTLLKALPTKSVKMILTSPPYDDLRAYSGLWSFPFEEIAREAYRVLDDGGVLVWVVGDQTVNGSETLTSMRQALYFVDRVGFKMHDTMIYQKDMAYPETNRYSPCFEYMFVLSKGKPTTFNRLTQKNKQAGTRITKTQRRRDGKMEASNGKRTGKRMPAQGALPNVWYFSSGYMKTTKDKEAYQHPAMFPEELARRHILTWTNPGDTVLDFFAGSGTTLKMARNLNRRYIGCDISSEYVELARKRLADTDPFMDRQVTSELKQRSLFAGVTI
jgi:DNA modification methylase